MASSIGNLDASYVSMINEIMSVERQPLTRLKERADGITVQKAVYSDLKKQLDTLQTSVRSMISGNSAYSFTTGYKAQVSPLTTGTNVLTASTSSSAVPATYSVAVEKLAREHRVRSDKQPVPPTQALNLSGTFAISGGGARAQSTRATLADTVTAFDTADLLAGQPELKAGQYTVETRHDETGGWQFRLVDSTRLPVSIQEGESGTFTNAWQSIPAAGEGESSVRVDTGRGLVVSFGADPAKYQTATFGDKAHPAARVDFTAQTATIDVKTSDSLADIAGMINKSKFPEGRRVIATVVDSQLILSAEAAGLGNGMSAADLSGGVLQQLGVLNGGTFKAANVMQEPSNAVMYVNGLRVERAQNSGLTNVIHGLTLNLAHDAEGKNASINVTPDSTKETETVNTFVKNFNSLMTYLNGKVATTKQADGTYKRGSLAGDTIYSSLRYELTRLVSTSHANSGTLRSLSQLGFELGENFQLSLKEPAKLEAALKSKANVTALLDPLMTQMDARLSRFTGDTGYIQNSTKTLDNQAKDLKSQITLMEERLTKREESLYQQYGQAQAQIMTLLYQQQQLSAFGSMNLYS